MPRVGTCKDCGARFKVPDGVKAATAKCAKCGGVVNIPPAEAPASGAAPAAPAAVRPAPPAPVAPVAPTVAKPAAPAARPAAPPARPSAAAHAGDKPARAGSSATRTRSSRLAGKDASPEASGAQHAPAGGRRARGERGAMQGERKKKGSPLMLVIAAVVVVGGGIGAWLAFSGDDAPAGGGASATVEAAPAGEADSAAPIAAQPDAVPTPAAAEPPAAAAAPAPDAGAPEPPAAAAPAATKVDTDTPRDPVVAIEPLGPVPGTTEEQLAEWTGLVKSLYIDDPGAKARKKLIAQLEEIDIVDSTPAYINAMIGLNMSNPIDIRNAGNLIGDWSKRQGVVIRFAFDQEASKTDTLDVNRRIIVVEGWRTSFAGKMASEQLLTKYREDVAAKLAAGGGD